MNRACDSVETRPLTCQMRLRMSPTQKQSTQCSVKKTESQPVMESKEKEAKVRVKRVFAKLLLKIPCSHREAETSGLLGSICFWSTDPFFNRIVALQEKNILRNSNVFHYTPSSQLLHSKEASSKPIILSWAQLYCTWHILERSHCGLMSVFSFHPTKRKSSGPRSRAQSHSLLGDGSGVRGSNPLLIEPVASVIEARGVKEKGDTAEEVSIWNLWWLCGCVCVCVCVSVVVSQDPAGLGAGHMSGGVGEVGARQPSTRRWPTWSHSCSLGNALLSSQRHCMCDQGN